MDLGTGGAGRHRHRGQPRHRPGRRPRPRRRRGARSSCAPATPAPSTPPSPSWARRRGGRFVVGCDRPGRGAGHRGRLPRRVRSARRPREQRRRGPAQAARRPHRRRLAGRPGGELPLGGSAGGGRRARDAGRRLGPHGPRRLDQRPRARPALRAVLGGQGGAAQPLDLARPDLRGRGRALSSCVVPGITLTELVDANAAAAPPSRPARPPTTSWPRCSGRHRVPVGRFGTPEEVADAVRVPVPASGPAGSAAPPSRSTAAPCAPREARSGGRIKSDGPTLTSARTAFVAPRLAGRPRRVHRGGRRARGRRPRRAGRGRALAGPARRGHHRPRAGLPPPPRRRRRPQGRACRRSCWRSTCG